MITDGHLKISTCQDCVFKGAEEKRREEKEKEKR
jgi:hypothetical protein